MAEGLRILVVDDFSIMRRIIRGVLRELGHENVLEADDGSTAWELLRTEHVDLVVSDWAMPRMKGIDLLEKVRSDPRLARLPFIMVTAEAKAENVAEAVRRGVTLYLIKPFTADLLGKKIARLFPVLAPSPRI